MTWKDFRDQVVAQLDKVGVHLSYQLNVDAHTWLDLSCMVDLMTTLTCVVAKALVAHKWVISMDIKNEVLRYCRNVRPTWVKFNSKDTKESGVGSRF